jgi:pimeloyl-ACP methyl ester carboxylesterase
MAQQILRDKAGFAELAYTTTGAGPVLLLLHGFPDDSGLWRHVAPELSNTFTVVCPDLPGAGGSALPTDGKLTIDRMAEAVAAVVEGVTDQPFVLAGHSMGGYAALAFAERFGDRLSGLGIVHSTASPDDEEKQAQRQKAIGLIQRGGKEPFLRDAVPKMFSPKFSDENPAPVREQIERGLRLPDTSAIAYYEAMIARPERTSVLRNAPFPLQWILGKDDAIIPLDKVLEQTHLASVSAVSIYEGVGHLAMLEAPARLAADLAEFANHCYKS